MLSKTFDITIDTALEFPDSVYDITQELGSTIKPSFSTSSAGWDEDWFKHVIIRNAEKDNRLDVTEGTSIIITDKTGQVITVNSLPFGPDWTDDNWIAMVTTTGKVSNDDGTASGDYMYYNFCTVNYDDKTLTFAAEIDLTNWEIDDTIVLYNYTLNYELFGNQGYDNGLLIPIAAAPDWRSTYNGAGPIIKHSDGSYRFFFTGVGYTPSRGALGCASSSDMETWTVLNTDAPFVEYNDIPNCTSVFWGSNVVSLGSGNYCCPLNCVASSPSGGGFCVIMYFDEDFGNISFSDVIEFENELTKGSFGFSVKYINGYYHMLRMTISDTVNLREIRAAKSLSIEGPYEDYQSIVQGSTYDLNKGVQYSNSVDAPMIGEINGRIFGLFGATSKWNASGGKGNRFYNLLEFNTNTETWVIDHKGPVIINPTYYEQLYESLHYLYVYDHCGGYLSLFTDTDNTNYLVLTMKSAVYLVHIIKLTI